MCLAGRPVPGRPTRSLRSLAPGRPRAATHDHRRALAGDLRAGTAGPVHLVRLLPARLPDLCAVYRRGLLPARPDHPDARPGVRPVARGRSAAARGVVVLPGMPRLRTGLPGRGAIRRAAGDLAGPAVARPAPAAAVPATDGRRVAHRLRAGDGPAPPACARGPARRRRVPDVGVFRADAVPPGEPGRPPAPAGPGRTAEPGLLRGAARAQRRVGPGPGDGPPPRRTATRNDRDHGRWVRCASPAGAPGSPCRTPATCATASGSTASRGR